ncbi:LOW QUALITY PROTEIN: somatomedin-B and thrombospondin type-1 domain-containing protein-like [Corvus cornix cornix]|uniref:LOW QUALITY PROTEIN: somatomedin-B and thrombospondin type-1 domain-containing protein-like n=1 Tax=Corvus cornix cornix TaxID=932674 RepID=UPI001950889C|nr:LOW QUALITY PROTEIN: somatomedin-B and thrombospondin type-1 domain-containing protein-like [Corvus cornix cornix]
MPRWCSWGSISSSPVLPIHRCSLAGFCCLMHSALLIILVNCMKSLPCRGAKGRRGAVEQKGTGFVPPPSPGAVRHGRSSQRGHRHSPRCSSGVRWCGAEPSSRGARTLRCHAGPAALGGLAAGHRLLVGATGSCRHRCCPGRNNACWAPGTRRALCYCDSYCQRTGDCCQDYPATCRRAAVGCSVGPWGPWSGCSSPCGVGSRARSRQVTVPPRHGGDPCPDLKQRRGCLGQHPTCGTAKEVAKILPSSFSQDLRDPWQRAGLLLPEEPSGSPLPSYCGYFRLTQVGPPCRGQAWSRRLHRDKQVCVECWGNLSQRHPHCTGHGLQGARTFWVAASVVGCQGSWVQEGLQEGCVCSPPALIFV